VKQLKVLGRDQSLLDYSFSEEQLNPPLDDSIFHFQIPAGAEVVDAVEFRSEQ
jgi:outer membrane lipoprotein-sorting protein